MARTRRRRISRKAEGIPKEYSKVRIIEIGLKHTSTMQSVLTKKHSMHSREVGAGGCASPAHRGQAVCLTELLAADDVAGVIEFDFERPVVLGRTVGTGAVTATYGELVTRR